MSATEIPIDETEAPTREAAAAGEDWLTDRQGRQYVRARGRRGIIYRSGGESLQEAFARDALPRDQKPRRTRTPKKAPPPKSVDLKEIEAILAEALKAPAMPCAAFGDAWAADHFTNAGPYLARNLCRAAETNAWLRKKLESAATGGDAVMQLAAFLGVGAAVMLYTAPPLIYWLNLPVPDKAREMFGIPDRRTDDGYTPPPPAAAAGPAGAPPAYPPA